MLRQARDPRARKQWLNDACKSLKHDQKGPQVLIEQMQGFLAQQKLAGPQNKIKAALTYFQNQQPLMKYALAPRTKLAFGFGSDRGSM